MILDEDLSDYEAAGKLAYLPVVQNPDENWTHAQGRITQQMLEHFMPLEYEDKGPKDSLIMVCGPPALKDSITAIANEMKISNLFTFN